MRGRKPKTDAERAAEAYRGHHPKRQNQVKAPRGAMKCPKEFSAEERSVWKDTLANAPFDVIRPADREVLIAFCQQVAISRYTMRELRKSAGQYAMGMVIESERGSVKNPLLTILDSTAKNIKSLASELGLSPVSRERVTQEREQEKSLHELLSEPRDSTPAKLN